MTLFRGKVSNQFGFSLQGKLLTLLHCHSHTQMVLIFVFSVLFERVERLKYLLRFLSVHPNLEWLKVLCDFTYIAGPDNRGTLSFSPFSSALRTNLSSNITCVQTRITSLSLIQKHDVCIKYAALLYYRRLCLQCRRACVLRLLIFVCITGKHCM